MARGAAIAVCVAMLASVSPAQDRNGGPGGPPAPEAVSPLPPPLADRAAEPGRYPDTAGFSAWLAFDDPGPFDALFTWYLPLFIRNGIALKEFIRSDAFAAFRKRAGDARAADAIYVRAMTLTANNTGAALLLAALATFDHYVVGVRIPVLNLFFPLTNESREEFAARLKNLPSDIYPDSPPGERGDRDKLQHFFGSAFVAMAFESRGAAERVGDFVEVGEDAAIVDGVLDSRDERANWNGREFGTALLADNRRYPSEFFRAPIVGGLGTGAAPGYAAEEPDTGCR